MTKYETTKNTLSQLSYKIYREHWNDIRLLEDEDYRYTTALDKASRFINKVESLWNDYKSKSNPVDLIKGLEELLGSFKEVL